MLNAGNVKIVALMKETKADMGSLKIRTIACGDCIDMLVFINGLITD